MNKPVTELDPTALDLLVRYPWPGNVRELENVVERAMVLANPPSIKPDDLPFQLGQSHAVPANDTLEAIERMHVETILHRAGWNITRAADILDIDRVTLYNKIAKYGLKKP
jgi:DNA-binding NtrC family response regulator